MTVADAAMPPAAAALWLVALAAAVPVTALRLVALAAADALIYLWFAIVWVGCAVSVAMVIARRALGEGSPVLSAVSYAGVFFAFLSPVAFMLIGVHVLGTGSKFNNTNANKDMKEPALERPRRILRDPLVIAVLIYAPFILLMPVGNQVMAPHVEGSRREWIGSVLMDLGILGTSAINCFIILPFMVLMVRRMKKGGDAIVLRHHPDEKV